MKTQILVTIDSTDPLPERLATALADRVYQWWIRTCTPSDVEVSVEIVREPPVREATPVMCDPSTVSTPGDGAR